MVKFSSKDSTRDDETWLRAQLGGEIVEPLTAARPEKRIVLQSRPRTAGAMTARA